MAIEFRDIEHAPLPLKEKKARQPRQSKYPMDGIAVGGARAFAIPEGKQPNSIRNSVAQAAKSYAKKNPGFAFKVRVADNEVLVHRLADEVQTPAESISAPATADAAETVTSGDYRGFAGMTASEMGDHSLAAAE